MTTKYVQVQYNSNEGKNGGSIRPYIRTMAERTVLARDLFLSCPYNVLPDARILVDESCAPLPPIFIIYFPGRYPLTNNDPNLILNLDPLLTRNAVLEWVSV
ncbi:hypothetical protein I7I50_01660 [Histoplasma capsulatum G186AR]|uniref:Uncharacterized protein n=1 Tax=Ajellomyces capsulatus TaxID=5037 RepID=A0A8H7YCA7_AJECA|nr:hypothetical protein I7I52_11876 [Histoplasma capsulatum]QSS70977.1 hypothetical protein I7I50_01660 [Histoplasma capsulatum G186AR]